MQLTRSLALLSLLAFGCKTDSTLSTDEGKIPTAPLFGHGGLGGTVIQAPLDTDAAASDSTLSSNCMGTDAFESGLVSDMKTESDLNCTSKDVTIGLATLRKYAPHAGSTTDYTGQPVNCPSGSTITLFFTLELSQVANSPRTDMGLWVADDDGTALTGQCTHYILRPLTTNVDGDFCGDLLPNVTVEAGLAGAIVSCDSLRDGLAHVGVCAGWTDPDSNRFCTANVQESRFLTVPANKAKCNCNGIDLAINIAPLS